MAGSETSGLLREELNNPLFKLAGGALSASGVGTNSWSLTPDDFIRINVCGMVYDTLKSNLEKYPNTLLGNPETRKPYYVEFKNAYFFDRHRGSFEAVLYFYQSNGSLIRPSDVSMKLFAEEAKFFGIPDEKLLKLQIMEGYVQEDDQQEEELPTNRWQKRLWILMEHPDSSLFARLIAIVSIMVILLSITTFCLESMPGFHDDLHVMNNATATNVSEVRVENPKSRKAMAIIEIIAIIWFTLEYILRFISSPNKWKFFKSFLNLIDLAAILPFYLMLAIQSKKGSSIAVIRVARLVRVFRVFKLSRHSMGLQTIGNTLRASVSELGMLVFMMAFTVLVFSSGLYYAEHESNEKMFHSIPGTFWFIIITMTTIGYGDIVPKTTIGKLMGGVCAVSGVLTIAMVVPVIITNFEFFYKRDLLNQQKLDDDEDNLTRLMEKENNGSPSPSDCNEMKAVKAV